MIDYSSVDVRVHGLIKCLEKVDTQYTYQKMYIGEAIGYLVLLLDIINNKEQKEKPSWAKDNWSI